MTKPSQTTSLLAFALSLAASLPLMAGNQYSVVADATFTGANSTRGSLATALGFVYGSSPLGGTNSMGTIFRFDPATNQYNVVHSFAGGDGGRDPSTGVIRTVNGLYGTTAGGTNGRGTLYRVNLLNNQVTTLHQFAAATGSSPGGPLLEGSDGRIYGIVESEAANNFGGIFRFDADGSNHTLLRSFTGTGGNVRGNGDRCKGIVEGTDGMLYGVTRQGGTNDTGVFFQMSKDGGSYSVFREWPTTGLRKPSNRILQASDGLFYGAASEGGAANKGGIYRISSGGDYTELHEFTDSNDGFLVRSELTEGTDGYLYGCAFLSNNNLGSLFRLAKDGSSFAVLHRFAGDPSDGSNPDTPLLETESGVFHGFTTGGGANSAGVAFRLATTVEKPSLQVRGSLRPVFRGRTLRLRGTATDDLEVVRVEYATKKTFKPAKGTTAWNARILIKPSAKRATVQVRALDNDAQVSSIATVRARRAK